MLAAAAYGKLLLDATATLLAAAAQLEQNVLLCFFADAGRNSELVGAPMHSIAKELKDVPAITAEPSNPCVSQKLVAMKVPAFRLPEVT